ncbi:MAG: tetratricopeptide repeat protein [Chthoniobacteraceae bacterium]|nr:tetratricopeptide repeat protein [Chthoniobacteraceae bacterium]
MRTLPMRTGRRSLLFWFWLCCLLLLGGVAASADEARHLRLAVNCVENGRPAPEIQDLITASLSKEPEVEMIERARIELLLGEGGAIQNPERRIQLGRILSLDYFLNFRRSGEAGKGAATWSVEVVNAQSGELVTGGSVVVKADPVETLTAHALTLIHRDLAGKPAAGPGAAAARVAVLDFVPEPKGAVEKVGQALRLSADVRAFLNSGGLTVLDRALAETVVRENGYLQEGFVENRTDRQPLLGADVVVTGNLGTEGAETRLEMTLLGTREGRVLAARHFAYRPDKEGGSLPEEARQWLVETLHPARSAERTFEETIQIEALEPFYQGIAKFCAGQYLEASEEFQKAYTSNDKFGDAMLWEARCYDALKLKPLADAERRFVKLGLLGRGTASSGKACPDDAITFLGITGAGGQEERVFAETVEMLAIDRLAREGSRLQLASHLARLRDEYDVLVGTDNAQGTRWTETPSFLSSRSLRGELGPANAEGTRGVSWFLVDTLTGKTVTKTSTRLGKNPADWKKRVAQGIADLLKSGEGAVAATDGPAAPIPLVAELEKQLSGRNGPAANRPLLQLALADPDNRLLAGRALAKGAEGRAEFDAMMNFAFRDFLLSKMSPQNPNRPWLELQRLETFLPFDQTGAYLSGSSVDARAGLTGFVAAHPADIPGCLAEYILLYDQLGSLAPEGLADRLVQLETRLESLNGAEANGLSELRGMTRALRITAQIATGKDTAQKLPTDIFAQRLRIEFDRDGKPAIRRRWGWLTMVWRNIAAAATNREEEARASLAVLGRGDELRRIDPRWLRDYPTSCGMMFFVIDGLHEVNHMFGKPFFYEFDAAAERGKFRDMTAYAHHNLMRQLDLASTRHDVNYLEPWVDQFVQYLTEPAYLNTVTDQEWETMRQELIVHMDEANERVGRVKSFDSHRFAADWRLMSRRPPAEDAPDRETVLARERPDRVQLLQEEQRVGDAAWQNAPATNRAWTDLVHTWRFDKQFNAREKARIYARYFPRLNTVYPGPDLSAAELGFLHDFGMTLLQGGEMTAADAVFARMLEGEPSDLNSFGSAVELRANAALNLAWNYRAEGRKAEALEWARRALEMSLQSGRPFHVLGRMNWRESQADLSEKADQVGTNLRAYALRLISELRNEGQTAPLPQRVKAVTVHTPSVENKTVTFYYRVPEKVKPGSPVLVVCPSQSEGALHYCAEGHPWAQFADKEGIVLCVPQFIPEPRWSDFPAFAGFQQAQVWSGQATLDALEKIRAETKIDSRRLLLYGYGGGAQFVQTFSRFAPERCVALSMHSAQNWLWKEGEPVPYPLSKLKNVPCLVTTGAEDNYGCDEWNRLAIAIQWTTMARGEGIPVLWKAWPGVAHQFAPGFEKMCTAFFADCLHPANKKAPFIGDIRKWVYYPSGDPRIESIPRNFRQDIPTRELATLWGTQAE